MSFLKFFPYTVVALFIFLTSMLAAHLGGRLAAFEKSNVFNDIATSTFDDEEFSLEKWNFDATKQTQIYSFVEFGYSFYANKQSDYGLYIYVYNPQSIEYVAAAAQNKITMSIGETESYTKYPLYFLNSSHGELEGLFYKYKIMLTADQRAEFITALNPEKRIYITAEIELLVKGNQNATAYNVPGTHTYSGYAAGYGENVGNTLIYDRLTPPETITIDLSGNEDGFDKRIYWRSPTSSLGKGHQWQINSVYFSIPNNILKRNNYELRTVDAEWYEYKLVPALVVANKEIYEKLLPYRGVDTFVEENKLINPDIPYNASVLYTFNQNDTDFYRYFSDSWNLDYTPQKQGLLGGYAYYYTSASYNHKGTFINRSIPMLFYTGGANLSEYTVSSNDLAEYCYNYKESYITGHKDINGRDFSNDLFESTVDDGHTAGYNRLTFDTRNKDQYLDINSYDRTHNYWDTLRDYGWTPFFGLFGTQTPNTSLSFEDIPPIYKVTDNDINDDDIENKLFIDSTQVESFKKFYNKVTNDKENPQTVYILRYGLYDYYAARGDIRSGQKYTGERIAECEFRQETAVFDFDIITFGFGDEKEVKIYIPAISSPVDHFTPLTPAWSPYYFNWPAFIIIEVLLLVIFIITKIVRRK